MKYFTLVFSLAIVVLSNAQNTLPVIPFGDRKADLYYWGDNWMDKYEHLNPNTTNYPASRVPDPDYMGDAYIGRACVADTPILIRGIAGAVKIDYFGNPVWTIDPSGNNRLPEWFMMYDTNLVLIGEGRWDTITPTYSMEFRSRTSRDTVPVYEIFFEKPVLVSGLFYVGGTTHNNLMQGLLNETENRSGYPRGLFTYYPGYRCDGQVPNPATRLHRYYWPYQDMYPGSWSHVLYDTSGFSVQYSDAFYPFFAIVDTDYIYQQCYVPTNLDVVLVDSDAVSLRWDDGAADHWEVEVWIDGSEPDSSIVYSTDTNNITLTGLDTSFWYCVKVKAVCDSFNSSDWSDVFRFHVPDYYVRTCPVPENLTVELMDSDWAMVRWNQIEGNASELALCKGDENEWDTISVQEYHFTDVNDLDYDQWYTVKIRAICDSNSVSEWSDTVMFYVPNPDTTGGDDTLSIITTSSPGLLIMPNPTDGITDIISQYKMSKIELFGSNGKCVMSKKADSVNETLDLRSLPSGLYIVRITTVDGVMTKRLVVVGK